MPDEPSKLTVETIRKMKEMLVGRSCMPYRDESTLVCEIRVYADLGRPARPYVKGPYPGSNVYEIHVPQKEEDMQDDLNGRHSLLAAWLHEIGHVIANVFGLPAAMRDPRAISSFPAVMSVHSDIDERIFAAEREAWDLADLIIGYDRTRNKALRSYQERMEVIRYDPAKDR